MSRIRSKRILAMILAAVMFLTTAVTLEFTPMTALAASSGSTIDVNDITTTSGDGWTYADGVFTVTGDVTIGSSAGVTTPVSTSIVVPSFADVEIVLGSSLGGVNIGSSGCAFQIQEGAKVNLKLFHFNTLVSGGMLHAGLEVAAGAELVIDDLDGTLTATGGTGGPGIGGEMDKGCGKITINGGYIIATSGGSFISTGAGIGGGTAKDSGEITINGGIVKATGKSTGAGIGGRVGGNGGKITINGGIVTATSVYAAGIGGGDNGGGGEITINGGIINAKGGAGANDIGSGDGGSTGTTKITGGSVFAANGLVNGLANPLYPVKLTVTDNDIKANDVTVTIGSYIAKTGGNLTGAFASTLDPGVAWLWLPEGEALIVADDEIENAGVANQTVATSGANTASIALVPYTYRLDWDGTPGTFAPLEYGYSTGSSVTYTIKNIGNKQITDINAAITAGSDTFEVDPGYSTTLAVGATATVTVTSKIGKNATNGTPHTGTLGITWTNGADPNTQSLSQTINKAAPTSLTPPTASAITYGAALSTSNLTDGSAGGTWEWTDGEPIPAVGNGWYEVTFTPTDMDNYDWSGVTSKKYTIDITINKADPSYTRPDNLTATYGDTLADVALPEGWAWEAAPTTSVGNAGNQTHKAKFTPKDTVNYTTVTGVDIVINVARKKITVPAAKTGLVYNGSLQTGVADGTNYTVINSTGKHAGTYTATVTPDSNHQWQDGTTAGKAVQFMIAKKAVTVTAENKSKKYGKKDPALTYKVSGLVGNDKLTGSLKYTGKTVGKYNIVEKIKFSHTNYTVTFKKGTMSIKPLGKTPKLITKNVPKSQSVKKGKKISLKAPKNTVLYYTINGKKPTTKSKRIKAGKTAKITIRKKTTVRVIAVKTGYTVSNEIKRTYKVRK